MPVDFLDAHRRHLRDAEFLYAAKRLPNADQLFGIAAECGLKRLMMAFGMTLRGDGAPAEGDDRQHIDKIWIRYETYRQNHVAGPNYVLPPCKPFSNWSVHQRYDSSGDISPAQGNEHYDGALIVQELIKKAATEGLI